MIILYFISILFVFIYIFIITHFLTGWNEIEEWETSDHFKSNVKISIIIPFRNEEQHIENCVRSVLSNQYPKNLFEVICVDDSSEDKGPEVVENIKSVNLSLLQLYDQSNQKLLRGKKAAIKKGIEHANNKLIVTLDADCIVPQYWLKNIASYYSYTDHKMIVGLVQQDGRKNVLEYFQIMDTCGTMGLHAAGIHNKTHFLANGANFIFEKELFTKIDPYKANEQFASGDDVFFINEFAKTEAKKIGFLKCRQSIVKTQAIQTWSGLWQQRKRWASKNSGFSHGIYKWMTGVIWMVSVTIVLNIILIPFTFGFSFFIVLSMLLIKGIMDFLYLQNMCGYFDQSKVLKKFIPAFFVQTFYILVMGVMALSGGKYEWKGRKVS